MTNIIATCRVPAEAQEGRTGATAPPGVPWVRLGDELMLLPESAQWQHVSAHAGEQGWALQRKADAVRTEELHLVVQKGRLFQQEHPEVPILLDHGRFLVVALDPERGRALERTREPCYTVQPLRHNQVVYEIRRPGAAREAPAPWIRDRVQQVQRSTYEADLVHLASFPTRFSTSAHYTEASAWARAQFDAMGYQTRFGSIDVSGAPSRNVIAERPGNGAGTRQVVLVTAHLDSISHPGGPAARAPGADDNGSGSAGALEIARALRDHPGTHDLRFVLLGGEEQGLFGSRQYVAGLATAERGRIRAVVNMDMIATRNSPSPSVLLEGAPLSQSVIDGLAGGATAHTSLTVQTSLDPHNSDHVPFIRAGIPAVLTIEGADDANTNIHSGNDTLDHIDYELALEILRMNVAFVASAVGRQG